MEAFFLLCYFGVALVFLVLTIFWWWIWQLFWRTFSMNVYDKCFLRMFSTKFSFDKFFFDELFFDTFFFDDFFLTNVFSTNLFDRFFSSKSFFLFFVSTKKGPNNVECCIKQLMKLKCTLRQMLKLKYDKQIQVQDKT